MVYLDQVNSGSSSPVEWNEFWYWLEKVYQHDHLLVDLIDQARREQYTLMERLYTWKVKELLGAAFTQPGQISVGVDPDKIKPFIHKLITGMLTPQPKDPKAPGAADILVISSRTLNSRDVAEETIEKVWTETVGEADVTPAIDIDTAKPSGDTADAAPTPDSSTPDNDGAKRDPGEDPDPHPNNDSRPRSPKPRKSDTHLYNGVRYAHMPDRLRKLIKECGELEISKHPEIASVAARVVVELAVDTLIDHQKLQPKGKQLNDKLAAVLRHLDPLLDSKNPTRIELAGTWAAVRTDTADGHFVRDLHNCVHAYQFTAAPEMAKRANVLFTPLLNAINTDLANPPASAVATSKKNGQA
jgi:hypothetical protein